MSGEAAPIDLSAFAQRVRVWVRGAATHAADCRARGDQLGDIYATARMRAYAECADIIESGIDNPAAIILNLAKSSHVGDMWPLREFDDFAVRYLRARAFQFVAHNIEPAMPIVQPKLAEGRYFK